MSFSLVKPTDWQFVTSGGGEITFGLMKVLFAGGQGGAFYVRQNQGPIYRLPYVGAVGGAGFGVSVAGPVSVSVSLPFAPGGGWRIYRNPFRQTPLTLKDFRGAFIAWSGAGSLGITSRSISLVVFGAPTYMATGFLTLMGAASFPALIAASEGVGVLWGSAVQSSGGVSAEVIGGAILPESLAEEGETGS